MCSISNGRWIVGTGLSDHLQPASIESVLLAELVLESESVLALHTAEAMFRILVPLRGRRPRQVGFGFRVRDEFMSLELTISGGETRLAWY